MAPIKYLITGATGGLGSRILQTLLSANIPASAIAASSTRASAAPAFEAQGVQFRHVDFDDAAVLQRAFVGVEKLFFISTNTIDNEKRKRQHANVVQAAREAGVERVYYSSLAFGGWGEAWDVELQVAHLETERLLRESGLMWTSVREGIYADAFPCFVNWYPTDPNQVLYLPCDGPVAFALRDELGEATAKLMMQDGHKNEIVLLTGPRTSTLSDLVAQVNKVTGRNVTIQFVSDEEYIARNSVNDEGGKPETFFCNWLSLLRGIEQGKAATVSQLMGALLGREPKDGVQAVKMLLEKDKDYTWHQNYVRKG